MQRRLLQIRQPVSTRMIRTLLPVALCVLCAGTTIAQTIAADDFQSLLRRGQALYERDRFDEAETALLKAVKQQSKSATARYWLGMTYYELKQYRKAEKHFRESIRRNKKSPEGYIGLGRVYMLMKNRMMDALITLKDALRYAPNSAQVHYYLGLAYMEQSKRDALAPLYVMKGRKSFQKTVTFDPRHPDAYYQLALSYEYPSRDYKTALLIYYKQLSVTPGHLDALIHLGKSGFLTGRHMEAAEMLEQLIDIHGDALHSYARTLIAQMNASHLQSEAKYELAAQRYEEYLDNQSPKERALYFDLTTVASEEELTAYRKAPDEEKQEFQRKYWASRDPDPATVVNERLVEHYRRVMHAREHYARNQYPWDRRGDIYIRYGEPDDMQHFIVSAGEKALVNYQPTGDARVDAIRERNHILRYRLKVDNAGTAWGSELARKIQDPDADGGISSQLGQNAHTFRLRAGRETQTLGFVSESWVYVRYDMELFFVDQLGLGKFDYPLGIHETNIEEANLQNKYHPERMARQLIKKTPESYSFDYGGEPLDFLYDIVTYQSEEGRTLVEVAYTVPTHQLGTVEDGQGLNTWFDSHVVLQDSAFRRIANTSGRIGPIERPITKPSKKKGVDLRTASLSLHAPAGAYTSAVEVRDEASRRIGIFQESLMVPDYTGDTLMVSDIKLATSILPRAEPGSFVRHGLEIVPNPSRIYRQSDPVHFYYEIYNLTKNDGSRTAYRTELEVTTVEKDRHIVWRFLTGFGKLIKQSDEDQSVLMIFEDEGQSTDEYRYMSIDTGDSPSGTYRMKLTITDLQNSQAASKTKTFIVKNTQTRWVDEKDQQPIDMRVVPDDANR